MPDWTDPTAYSFTADLSADQWAWEFLRRCPRYRSAWLDFITTWRALEATYGRPAERDVAAWQRDPRAWVPAVECRDSDCRVDGDKVLIECAMGARWGFYKFPPDPGDDDPVGGGRLVWREQPVSVRLLEEEPAAIRPSVEEALVCFDLSLPLAGQLEAAKRCLQMEQRRRIRSGRVLAPRLAGHREQLCRQLRLLDALEAEVNPELIRQRLYAGVDGDYIHERDQAIELRDRDYRRLLLLG
ncbi:MAG: hypothetical protein PVG22_01270 [Chromatiales bacterium]|jgi:hypothetical protein